MELNKIAKNIGIKGWAEYDRPREKLINKGYEALSDAELIALLIQCGTKDKSAVDLAREVLQLGNYNLSFLGRLSFKDFQRVKGVGKVRAIILMAALELGRRRQLEAGLVQKDIATSKTAADILVPLLGDLLQEKFCVLCLSASNKLLHYEIISSGGPTSTVADPKIIFKTAIQFLATKIIIAHNHPSGNVKPSRQDRLLTEKLKAGAKLLDLHLADHIIVADKKYLSFADEGLL